MRYHLLLLFGIVSGTAFSQNYTLQAKYFDSLVFEVRKGRACENVVVAQSLELKAADSVIHQGKRVMGLQDQKLKNVEFHVEILKRELSDSRLIWDDQRKKYRQRIRRQRIALIGLGALSVLLAVL